MSRKLIARIFTISLWLKSKSGRPQIWSCSRGGYSTDKMAVSSGQNWQQMGEIKGCSTLW